MKRWAVVVVSAFAVLCVSYAASTAGPEATAHEQLRQGNGLFVAGHPRAHDYTHDRAGLVRSQHPYAIVLTCADSRVPPEIIFDESLGRLFVVRVAGNVVDPDVLGSIEYAAEHLHTHYLLVMGHDGCGAVTASLTGGDAPANIAALVKRIAPAAVAAKQQGLDSTRTLDAAVRGNVRLQMAEVTQQSTLLAEMVEKKELEVEGAVYHLDSGRVEWLSVAKAGGK